jgi:hypothetical protein
MRQPLTLAKPPEKLPLQARYWLHYTAHIAKYKQRQEADRIGNLLTKDSASNPAQAALASELARRFQVASQGGRFSKGSLTYSANFIYLIFTLIMCHSRMLIFSNKTLML